VIRPILSACKNVLNFTYLVIRHAWLWSNKPIVVKYLWYTLRKKRVHWGSIYKSIGFFTQLQRTFYAKKRFYNDKKEHFWHKGSL